MGLLFYEPSPGYGDWSDETWGEDPVEGPFNLPPPGIGDGGECNGAVITVDGNVECAEITNTLGGQLIVEDEGITITAGIYGADAMSPCVYVDYAGTLVLAGYATAVGAGAIGVSVDGTLVSLTGSVSGYDGGRGLVVNSGALVGTITGDSFGEGPGSSGFVNEGTIGLLTGSAFGTSSGLGFSNLVSSGVITLWECTGQSAGNYNGGEITEMLLLNTAASVWAWDPEEEGGNLAPLLTNLSGAIVPDPGDVKADVEYDGGLKVGTLEPGGVPGTLVV